jgi:hypothetical protein
MSDMPNKAHVGRVDLGYTDKNPAYGLLKKILPPKNKRNLIEPDPLIGKNWICSWRQHGESYLNLSH